MNTLFKSTLVIVGALFVWGCAPSASQLEKTVSENPDIILKAIEKHPYEFMKALEKASFDAKQVAEQKRQEEMFKNPKNPKIDDNRVIFGNPKAAITIVEYSDFECPYCERGYKTVKQVMEEYGDQVRVIYKHLPLSFHPLARPASEYYEAIGLQDKSKAEKFHDMIFDNPEKLKKQKEGFLKTAAKKVGADMARLKKDIKSEAVKKIIDADIAEATEFGFSGTPGFLINGVALKGAYPLPEFKKIIEKVKK